MYQTGALALLQIACFAIWGFVAGAMLLRRPCADQGVRANPAPF
jgi:hypothetical protein